MISHFELLDTGHCWASEHHVRRDGARRRIACHALAALFHHSVHGWILFDTGYAPRYLDATRQLPYAIYRWVLPVDIGPERSVVRQLAMRGLEPRDISWIILSHFHADHLAGLLDFPGSSIVCTRQGFDYASRLRGLAALRRAFLPQLMPGDFANRARWVESFSSEPVAGLGGTHDLFGDGLIRLVPLPGHARGQIGALVQTDSRHCFLAADGCWHCHSYRHQQPPHWITHGLVDDVRQMHETLRRIQEYHLSSPATIIMPCHCPEVYEQHVRPLQEPAAGPKSGDSPPIKTED